MKILVGIPTYNGAHRVDWLLKSISMRTGKNIEYKIVVCDDSGKKDHQEKTISLVDKWNSLLPIVLIINNKNMGVAATWNILIRSQSSQYIILINDDIIVAKDWLENMVYFLENNNIGAVGYDCAIINEEDMPGLVISIDATVKPRDYFTRAQIDNFDYNQNLPPLRCPISSGCFFGFNRDKYNLVGGFDENYYAFSEEFDFYTALVSRGYPNYYLRCPNNWHVISATFKTAPEINANVISERSRLYYIKKWNGDHTVVESRYMSRIPFQRVKWICNNKIYEDIITSNYGYYTIDEIRNFVTEGYRNILKRDPDESGLNHHVDLISSGRLTREKFLDVLRCSKEYMIRFKVN